jgi:hypothetical protein
MLSDDSEKQAISRAARMLSSMNGLTIIFDPGMVDGLKPQARLTS